MPLFFAGQFNELISISHVFIAFIAFSLSASAVYILNDLQDIKADQLHPKKRFRPLASGAVTKNVAVGIMFALLLFSVSLMYWLSETATAVLLGYVALNIAYSFSLKHISILDITIIATGFVLRLFVGSTVTQTPLSMWIVIMTFLLALFMALAKRRDDVLLYNDSGEKMRKAVDGYTVQLIDAAMMIMASVVIVAYLLYTTSAEVVARLHSDYLYLTALFVILGVMRYLQITFVEMNSASPTRVVLTDRFIQFTILGWLLAFVWLLYL
ncbi:MAG: UbiA prenyltransferase family protein [Gammaproteobacteria bacterium]|nr:UbiA prenyltransferase family protein [Gammaproteobacteria bacterium]